MAETLLQRTTASAVALAYAPSPGPLSLMVRAGRGDARRGTTGSFSLSDPWASGGGRRTYCCPSCIPSKREAGAFRAQRAELGAAQGQRNEHGHGGDGCGLRRGGAARSHVNTVRVLGRFFGFQPLPGVGDSHLHSFARCLTVGEKSLSVSWAVLDFGALICRARRPLCQSCPLGECCASFASSSPLDHDDFPFRGYPREQKQETASSAEPVARKEK